MKGLIIAAGQGTRIKDKGDCKPLIPLLDKPLIERVISTAYEGGVDSFVVVTGYKHNELAAFLEDLSQQTNIPISVIYNEEWTKENGISVLKAQSLMTERFVLMMSDHMFDSYVISKLLKADLGNQDNLNTYLCVDKHLKNPLVDLDDVTKVLEKEGKIVDIGKTIENYNSFDTGIFCCALEIFEALKKSSFIYGDTSLSGAMRILGTEGKARVFDITGAFWVDVDNAEMYEKAASYLSK